ncbi:MAG: hypothetical protein K6B52_01990 [Clostridiales bacterium]|nr:hypothetical protein [Clostridiales bacterium]
MIDQKAMAYINMYAVLGALENLCELAPEAREALTNKKPISIGFEVKDGPSATITFANGLCRMEQGCKKCNVKLPFSSCEKFNGLIDGTVTPIPSKGFTHIGFLLKDFTKLTDILNKYLRPSEEDLKDPEFFRINTALTLNVIGVAIAQVGNKDEIGKFSADHIVDGSVMMAIKDGPAVEIACKDHHLLCYKKRPDTYRSSMVFDSYETANALFAGTVNALACIGTGKIEMHGQINMIDNINRILDRVALYLA